jgi:hypothetical protein
MVILNLEKTTIWFTTGMMECKKDVVNSFSKGTLHKTSLA